MGAVLAARNMTAKRRRAAALDRAHHLELGEAQMAAVGFTPGGTVVAEDIRNLQSWTGHCARRLSRQSSLDAGPRTVLLDHGDISRR
jgi:hypothetical protein